MKKISIDIKNPDKKDLDLIADYFKSGKVVVYPTDTVYGIGCIATAEKPIKKIVNIKKRKNGKSFIMLVKSFCMTKKYAKVGKSQDNFLRSVWVARTNSEAANKKNAQNPTTVVLSSREGLLPDLVLAKDRSIALRLPANDFLLKLLRGVDIPIISTSFNRSGEKPLLNLLEIDKIISEIKPDLIVDAGQLSKATPSSIVDARNTDDIKKIR